MAGGDLYALLRRDGFAHRGPGGGYPAAAIARVLLDVCKGMIYLHRSAQVVHGDLSSGNILLVHKDLFAALRHSDSADGLVVAKVADFGIARDAAPTAAAPSPRPQPEALPPANLLYAAPELLRAHVAAARQRLRETAAPGEGGGSGGSPCTSTASGDDARETSSGAEGSAGPSVASDIFAFGIVAAEAFSAGAALDVDLRRFAPADGALGPERSLAQVVHAVLHDHLRPQVPAACPPSLAALLPSLWHASPLGRPGFHTVVLPALVASLELCPGQSPGPVAEELRTSPEL
jgi:serine/threonine protein kinase